MSDKKVIGIIGAMEVEVTALKNEMNVTRIVKKASMEFYEGTLHGKHIVVVKSGIGKIHGALCTQVLVDEFQITAVINTGIAGSLKKEINIGDIVVSTDALQHDFHVGGPLGYEKGQIPGLDTLAFPADQELIDLACNSCKKANPDIQVFKGRVVTGDQFIFKQSKKDELIKDFQGYCTEMEGGAIAHAAYVNRIPFVIIRAISDKADDSATMDYDEFEKQAADHSVRLTNEMIKHI